MIKQKKKKKSFRKKVREGYQISFEEEKEKRQKILGTDIKTCWRRKKKKYQYHCDRNKNLSEE